MGRWGWGGITDLQGSFGDAGLAVLDDLVQGLKRPWGGGGGGKEGA